MKTVFISYDHDDQKSRLDVESVRKNGNNSIVFHDGSLNEPVLNSNGHINRRMPSDLASKGVRDKIENKLKDSSKLLVLIGRNTHSSKWVEWEIDTFKSIKKKPDILFMRVKGDASSRLANKNYSALIKNWNMLELNNWLG